MNMYGRAAWLSLAALLTVAVAGCGSADQGEFNSPGASRAFALSSQEEAFLRFTREEEKLARDVYGAIGSAHPSFAIIAKSEQIHMDAVGALLTRYGVDDPTLGKAAGEFTDEAIQKLYRDLVAKGSGGRVAALEVGVEIEDLDIADIEGGVTQVTHQDIATTMANLTRGSRNHLRSFYASLGAAGGSYEPKHLDPAAFDAIVTSAKERGRGFGRRQ